MTDKYRIFYRKHDTTVITIIIVFLTPVLNSQGMKKYAMQYKKYKNQAGMNLTSPSQNSHAVRWHSTAESERRVAEIKMLISLSSPD